jgi:hypothetical protein
VNGGIGNLGRHKRTCSVCRHEQRDEIEGAFVGWRSPAANLGGIRQTVRASSLLYRGGGTRL